MSGYMTVVEDDVTVLVVRLADSRVVAKCSSQTFANQVAAGLDSLAGETSKPAGRPRRG